MTPEKAVYLLVVDGFADWEPAHAVAELRRHGQFRVETVGLTSAAVQTMGGIRVLPSKVVANVDPADVAAFILPGGDRWESSPVEPEIGRLLNRLDAQGVPIAAICAATVAISRLGLLRGRRHTSNGLEYLRSHVPGYADAANYVDAPAVRDRGLITASGLGDVEFARELFEELSVLSAGDRAAWAAIFRSGRLRVESTPMDEQALFTHFWTTESTTTRKVLARIPEGSDYRPDPKSRTAREIAWQIVCEEKMIIEALETGKVEWAPAPTPATMKEVAGAYEKQSADIARRWKELSAARWNGTLDFFGTERPASPMAWSFLFDIVHHRGQITTYLRPMGSTVPQIYGPSGDEP